nr:hypothetical protein [Tanacetum cinerariifolium]
SALTAIRWATFQGSAELPEAKTGEGETTTDRGLSPTESKIDKAEKAKKFPVKYAEQYRKTNKKPNKKGEKGTSRYQDDTHKSFTPRPVAHRPYKSLVRPVRSNMNCARPSRTTFNKQAHSYANIPFQRTSALRSQYRATWVSTVNRNFPPVNRKFSTGSRNFLTTNRNFPTASRKFPTGSTKYSIADMGMKRKVVKPSACWFWKPSQNLSNEVRSPFIAPGVPIVNKNYSPINRKFSTGSINFPTANRKFPTASRKFSTGSTKSITADMVLKGKAGSSQSKIDDKGYWDSGCSRHMTCNISYLSDFEPYDGGYVSFGQGGCKITRKGTIKMGKLEFEKVYFVKDLKYNLFSVSQMCDNKNSVLFTDLECIVLGRDFKLLDDANILLRTPRQHNMYSINLNNIFSHRDLTCLVAKASANEYMLWHMRLGHLNFKTMNKLVRHNLVRGLHTKCFENDHTCTACLKGKQHKASCKSKLVNSVSKPLHTLHMDLFGPTSVSSISHKWYCLVVTDDFSSGILKKFITKIKNLKDLNVKIIRCDNGGEFRNKEMNDFFSQKGIKREFSNARTPQQNGVAERRNRILIKVARTMLADAKLPVTFWGEVVNTACYVQNRVLVNKSHNKTPYELFNDRSPAIGFLKPFGCHVMILNTLDNLGKFKEKGDEGYFIGYSMSSKAFRVFNKRTRRVEENLHVEFLENKAIGKGAGPNWLFDIDILTKSMNYVPVDAGTLSTNLSGTKYVTSQEVKKDVSSLRYIALPNWDHDALLEFSSKNPQDHCSTEVPKGSGNSNPTASTSNPPVDQMETLTVETLIPIVSSPVPTAYSTDSQEPLNESNREEADISNMETIITTSSTPTLGIHKNHPKSQINGPVDTPIQSRNKFKEVGEQSFIAIIHQKTDPDLLQFCLFLCFLSQVESKKISDALQDPSWVEAMQEELLQFKIQNEEGIDYDEVFAPVARIEAIILFLAYASFMGFTVYQMDEKSAFLYGTIDEVVYVMQPPGFQDPKFPTKVYKVEKAIKQREDFILVQIYVDDIIFGSSNPQLCREFKALMHDNLQMRTMGELNFFLGLQVLQKEDDIFLSQDKYVGDILKKFGYSDVRSSNTPMDKENPRGKDGTGKDVDLHLYRSMIGSRIFRYLKGHPKLGLWYPKESPFDIVSFSDSDYGGATHDRESTTRGCQFLGRRLISWQCKKQTIVATSTTEA